MLLLTPGPLTTAKATREAMLVDHGSRDGRFVELVGRVRRRLVALCAAEPEFSCVLMQGSGTFAVEACIGTLVPRHGRALVLVNGAYGRRMAEICRRIGREVAELSWPEESPVDPVRVSTALRDDPGVTHVLAVHCETTTGLLNPIAGIAAVVAEHGRRLIVDAMSAFGALPVAGPFEAVVASSNKCLEGVPGVGFVVARTDALLAAEGNCHSVSLDLHDSLRRFAHDGQWRFTPPTHVLAALDTALRLHAEEGGVAGRGARYAASCARLVAGMRALGFEPLLPDALQAPIIVTFVAPDAPWWAFTAFYEALRGRGFAIYPGKLTQRPTFRVGCIGQVHPADIDRFLEAVKATMAELGA